ncbi:TonB-dependent receptor [Lysobacter korlensis]|uniref:TonB-dependent receptor n=1 Tax=Lysobacter korlensis TaxID=553636 RepID=A0ABV6RKB3_9GAMM
MSPRKCPLFLALVAALTAPAVSAQMAPSQTLAATTVETTEAREAGASDARTLDSVVVTATRGTKAIDKIPGAVSVITRSELDAQLQITEDLSQVLATQIPGYAPSRQKLTTFGESLRGRTPLILFDGVPQSNPLRNGAREGYFADPSVIERIEVVSGASAVQGLGATGGIINYISRTPRIKGTSHTVDLKYGTQGESDDALWKAGYGLEHKQRFDALLYVGATMRGVGVDGENRRLGLEATQGDVQDSTATDLFAKVGLDISDAQRVQVSFNRFLLEGDGDWTRVDGDRDAGILTSAVRGEPVGLPPRNRVQTASLDWMHADLAGGTANVQLYKQDFESVYGAGTFGVFQDPAIAPVNTLVDQSEIIADKAGLRTTWVRPDLFLNGLEMTVGVDWLSDESEQQLAQTGRTWVPPLEFENVALFTQAEYTSGAFTVRGGARREHATLEVEDYTTLAVRQSNGSYRRFDVAGGGRSFTQWVGNLGAVWRFADGWSAFAAYNEGFGLPDVGLVLRGVRAEGQSVGDLIALEPIVTDNREVGITWAGALGSFTASAYDSRSELGSQVRVDRITGQGSIQRVPVEVSGFEFAGELRPHQDWALTATYATTRGKTAAEEDAPLDLALGARSQGPDKAVAAVRWQASPSVAVWLQAMHLFSRHVNEGRVINNGLTSLEENFNGYTIADLGVTWNSRWGQFGLGVENLFDRQYVGYYSQANNSGNNLDYFAGRGRAYLLSWQRTFR